MVWMGIKHAKEGRRGNISYMASWKRHNLEVGEGQTNTLVSLLYEAGTDWIPHEKQGKTDYSKVTQ